MTRRLAATAAIALSIVTVALAESLLGVALLLTYFELDLVGDPTPLIVATVLYSFCVAAFGTMVGAIIPSQAAAMQAVALGGFLLVFLLSGLLFPVENIPVGLRWLSYFVWVHRLVRFSHFRIAGPDALAWASCGQ